MSEVFTTPKTPEQIFQEIVDKIQIIIQSIPNDKSGIDDVSKLLSMQNTASQYLAIYKDTTLVDNFRTSSTEVLNNINQLLSDLSNLKITYTNEINKLITDYNQLLLKLINDASIIFFYKNYLINGYFLVWQDGVLKFIGASYVADMWLCYRAGSDVGATISRVLGRKPRSYAMRLQRDIGNSSTSYIATSQPIESIRTADLAGERVTLSFYARCGSGYSGDSTSLTFGVRSTNIHIDTNMVYIGDLLAEVKTKPTTEWTLYTTTLDIPQDSTQLSALIYYTPSGVAGSNDYIDIADVILNKGNKRVESNDTYEDTLRDCQRYYEKSNGNSAFKRVYNTSDTTKLLAISCDFKVTKRTTPTMTVVGRVSDGENFTSWEGGMSLSSDYFSAYKFISPSEYLDFSYYVADARL